MPFTEAQLVAERDKHENWLSQQHGITGTGIGLDRGGQPCIKIYTHRMPAVTKSAILGRLKSLPVEFEETGEFRAF